MTDERPAGRDAIEGVDVGRRMFFRRFAGDVVTAASSAIGVLGVLQEESAEAARDLLGAAEEEPAPGGFRTAYRWDGDVLRIVDQRRLPDVLHEYEARGGAEAAFAIREGIVRGAPAIGQVAAIGMALTAGRHRTARSHARRAQLRGTAKALRAARPAVADLSRAVDRMLARLESLDGGLADGDSVAAALRAEAETIVFEALTDHGLVASHGLAALPVPEDRPLRVLTLGSTGVLAGGQAGIALAILVGAHHAGRSIHVHVAETRPELLGSRVTAWELAGAGVSHTIVADAAAGALLADGEVDLVLVGAERIAADGAIAAVVGTHALAVVAAHHGVPFLVVAPTTTIDTAYVGAAALPREERRGDLVIRFRDVRVAAPGTLARDLVVDVTPADLVTAFITDAGVVDPPFGPALADALADATARHAALPQFDALVEAVAGSDAGEAEPAERAEQAEPEAPAEQAEPVSPGELAEPAPAEHAGPVSAEPAEDAAPPGDDDPEARA